MAFASTATFSVEGVTISDSAGGTNQIDALDKVSWGTIACDSSSSNALDVQIHYRGGIITQYQLAAGESEEFGSTSRGNDVEGVYLEGDGGNAVATLRVRALGG